MTLTTDQQNYYNQAWPLALAQSAKTGIDATIIFAQSALETGWGQHAPNNNYFGIKGSGGTQTTQEFIGGVWQTIQAPFKGFASMADSFAGYGNFMSTNRYANVRNGATQADQLAALGSSGYATDPNYTDKLQGIINMLPSTGTLGGALPKLSDLANGITSSASNALDTAGSAVSGAVGSATDAIGLTGDGSFISWLKNLFSFHTAARFSAVIIGIILIAIAIAAFALTSDTGKAAAKAAVVA